MTQRRRIKNGGLLVLLAIALSACIFDKGDYKGGGHVPLLTASNTGDDGGEPPPGVPPGPSDAGGGG